MKKPAFLFGLSLGLLLILLKSIEYLFISYTISFEFYAGLIGVAFFVTGIWAGIKLNREKSMANPGHQEPTKNLLVDHGLSDREVDVLIEITNGLSNQEIADKLFVSLNTVKTHIANIYTKLHVKRRAQAISKAKIMGLIG